MRKGFSRQVDGNGSRQQNRFKVTHSPRFKVSKTIAAALTLLTSMSCSGSAPPPAVATGQPYAVISEKADPAAGTLTLSVSVSSPATQANLKSIAESVIGERKSEFRRITVKLYSPDAGASDRPLAVSRLENDAISHQFNPRTETERIQTH